MGGIFISLHFIHNGMIQLFKFYNRLPLESDMSLQRRLFFQVSKTKQRAIIDTCVALIWTAF